MPRLFTEYDFFVQPGLGQAFIQQPNRLFDLGIRLSNRYQVPSSNWTLGSNFELAYTFFQGPSRAANVSGLIALNSSYRISKVFATQHWITSFYKHERGDPVLKFSWDITGMPYFQNGISMNLTKEYTVSFLLNHYAFQIPSLRGIWLSLWTSLSLE